MSLRDMAVAGDSPRTRPKATVRRTREPRNESARSTSVEDEREPRSRRRTPVRAPRVPAAARRRAVVAGLGDQGQPGAQPGYVRGVAVARRPDAGRRLAHLHDLGLDADLRRAIVAARARRPGEDAAHPDLRRSARAAAG